MSERSSDFSFENLRKNKKIKNKIFVPVVLRKTMIMLYRHDENFKSSEIRIRKRRPIMETRDFMKELVGG